MMKKNFEKVLMVLASTAALALPTTALAGENLAADDYVEIFG